RLDVHLDLRELAAGDAVLERAVRVAPLALERLRVAFELRAGGLPRGGRRFRRTEQRSARLLRGVARAGPEARRRRRAAGERPVRPLGAAEVDGDRRELEPEHLGD